MLGGTQLDWHIGSHMAVISSVPVSVMAPATGFFPQSKGPMLTFLQLIETEDVSEDAHEA